MNEPTLRPKTYRPTLGIYHPNAKGTGAALSLQLTPASPAVGDGYMELKVARQMNQPTTDGNPHAFPVFDWAGAPTCRLYFEDLAKLVQVFRGETERLEDGKGLVFDGPTSRTVVKFEHNLAPYLGYTLEAVTTDIDTPPGTTNPATARICLSYAEGLGVCESICGAFCILTFGVPGVLAN